MAFGDDIAEHVFLHVGVGVVVLEFSGIERHDATRVDDERVGGKSFEVSDERIGIESSRLIGGEVGLDDTQVVRLPPGYIVWPCHAHWCGGLLGSTAREEEKEEKEEELKE